MGARVASHPTGRQLVGITIRSANSLPTYVISGRASAREYRPCNLSAWAARWRGRTEAARHPIAPAHFGNANRRGRIARHTNYGAPTGYRQHNHPNHYIGSSILCARLCRRRISANMTSGACSWGLGGVGGRYFGAPLSIGRIIDRLGAIGTVRPARPPRRISNRDKGEGVANGRRV